jgi:hypothetical protein
VTFTEGEVTETMFYFFTRNEGCVNCLECFNEIDLFTTRINNGEPNHRIEKNFSVTKSEIESEIDFNGSVDLTIYFADMIEPFYKYDMVSMQNIVNLINAQPANTYVLIGHSSTSGSKKSRLDTSKKRAETLKESLINDYGLIPDKISTNGVGSENHIIYTKSIILGSANIRVELALNNGEF